MVFGPIIYESFDAFPTGQLGAQVFESYDAFPAGLPGPVITEVYDGLVRHLLLRSDQVRAPLLAVLRGANMNTTSDQPLTLGPKNYVVRRVVVTNASISLTSAVGGIYTGAGKTGTQLVPAGQSYAALIDSTKYVTTSLGAAVATDTFINGTIFFSLTTPQGAAATADIYIYGDAVEP